MSSDPYRAFCVHGTLPLVSDPGSACGFRFAVLGEDPVSACITDPAELPDADISLRMFGNAAEIEGYVAALADLGGNNLSTLVAPPSANTPPFLLLVIHDRRRTAATTLDEAIHLAGRRQPDPAQWSRSRYRQGLDLEDKRQREALDERWSEHRQAIQGKEGFWLTGTAEDGIEFMSSHGGTRFVLGGTAESPVVAWNPVAYRFDDDLAEIYAAGIAESGAVSPSPGVFRLELADLSEAELRRALAADRHIVLLEEQLADLSDARRKYAEVQNHPAAMTVLKRAVEGLPVLTKGNADPGLQLAPRTGSGQTIPGVLINRLVRARLLTLAWRPAGPETRIDPTTWCPRIYVAAPAAHLMVEGRAKEAADLVGSIRSSVGDEDQIYSGTLMEAMAAMAADLGPEKCEAVGAMVEKRLATYGDELRWTIRGGRSDGEWVPIACGMISGLVAIDYDPGGTELVVRRTSPDPSPGPRP